jgi:hypothetical protein
MLVASPLSQTSLALQANYRIGDPILHIELRRWADIVLIAPCSANTLAKIASGVCDNLAVSPLPPSPPSILSVCPSFRRPFVSQPTILFFFFFDVVPKKKLK